ncbi:MAG: FAD binding domain-containing protein [Gammaproteobacteria bacterium]
MRPAAFEFLRPRTIDDALAAIARGGRPLAGGQSLLPVMRLRDTEPTALVDLDAIAQLDGVLRCDDEHLHIGAHVTHRAISEHPEVVAEFPWLSEAARGIGDVQVRNLGTVLGNLCWADPRANMAVALLASDASVIAAAPNGARERIALGEFFMGFRRNVLGSRLAVAIVVPRHSGARGSYLEFSRQPQDLALVNVCVVRQGELMRIAVGGIADVPVRLQAVEDAGMAALEHTLTRAHYAPVVDHHGDADYKLHLAGVLARRALAASGARV